MAKNYRPFILWVPKTAKRYFHNFKIWQIFTENDKESDARADCFVALF